VLAQADRDTLQRLRQITIEFHDARNFADRDWRNTALAALADPMVSHAGIHVHGNNWSSFTVIGGIAFPDSFEATFIRRADHPLVPSSASFPTPIDRQTIRKNRISSLERGTIGRALNRRQDRLGSAKLRLWGSLPASPRLVLRCCRQPRLSSRWRAAFVSRIIRQSAPPKIRRDQDSPAFTKPSATTRLLKAHHPPGDPRS
jgi:hypothetical protein